MSSIPNDIDAAAGAGDDGHTGRFHRGSMEAARAERKSVDSVQDAADDDVADHTVGRQPIDLRIGETEDPREHVAVVLAEQR
jgi:hypothetical protein